MPRPFGIVISVCAYAYVYLYANSSAYFKIFSVQFEVEIQMKRSAHHLRWFHLNFFQPFYVAWFGLRFPTCQDCEHIFFLLSSQCKKYLIASCSFLLSHALWLARHFVQFNLRFAHLSCTNAKNIVLNFASLPLDFALVSSNHRNDALNSSKQPRFIHINLNDMWSKLHSSVILSISNRFISFHRIHCLVGHVHMTYMRLKSVW